MDANGIPTYEELEKYFWRRLGEEVLVHLDKTVIVWVFSFLSSYLFSFFSFFFFLFSFFFSSKLMFHKWEDDTFVNEIPVPQNALIHVWQQDSYMTDVIKAGKQVIRSNGNFNLIFFKKTDN